MVCAACAKLQKPTSLATPTPKRKSEQYHLSLQSTSASRASTSNGITKNKLLGKGAKNPYAVYAASCEKCKTKVEQGKRYCQSCAYKANGRVSHVVLGYD